MKKNITQPSASMLDHQIHSPLQSISWCIVLQWADGPQADPAAWPLDSPADKSKHSGCEFMTMKKLLSAFGCVAQVSVWPFYIQCKQWRDALWGKGTWGHSPFPTCQCHNWMAGRGALLEPWWGEAKSQLEVRRQNEEKKKEKKYRDVG